MGISTSFWNAVITTLPATPASAPLPMWTARDGDAAELFSSDMAAPFPNPWGPMSTARQYSRV